MALTDTSLLRALMRAGAHPHLRSLVTAGVTTGLAVGIARNRLSWEAILALAVLAGLVLTALVVRRRRAPVRHDVIDVVEAWISDLDPVSASETIAAGALDVARQLTSTRHAELVLFREGVGWHLRHRGDRRDAGWHPLSEPLTYAGFHASLSQGTQAWRLDGDPATETPDDARLRSALLGDVSGAVLAVPVLGSIARGTLLVADPDGARLGPDAEAHLRLLAAHLAGQLDASLASDRVRNAIERKLHTATTDVLTGLPNRAVFVDRVDDAARLSSPTLLMAVLLVNLDRFREINATFGHQVGDHLLKQFGARLRDALPVTSTVARIGGDEFAVLLCELRDEHTATLVAADLLADVTRPYAVGDAMLQLDASMGVALSPVHADDATRLLQRADIAMETAKTARSGVEVYDPGRGSHNAGQLKLLADLRRAIEGDEGLSMVYQPKAGLRSLRVSGVEALLRWTHDERGRVPPGEFIPIAERTGLINPLTRWVLRSVLAQQRAWMDDGVELEVAVNLSARNLLDSSLADDIAALLDEFGLPASLLRLEITESSIIVDPGRAEAILEELYRLGVRLSVDDFGTGYSSLAHLLRLPVDEIKIDQSFVGGLLARRSEAAIVRATVDLGRRLAMTVTAEGVEDRETWEKLAELGCDAGQGYWYARPMNAEALAVWMRGHPEAVGRTGAGADATSPAPSTPTTTV